MISRREVSRLFSCEFPTRLLLGQAPGPFIAALNACHTESVSLRHRLGEWTDLSPERAIWLHGESERESGGARVEPPGPATDPTLASAEAGGPTASDGGSSERTEWAKVGSELRVGSEWAREGLAAYSEMRRRHPEAHRALERVLQCFGRFGSPPGEESGRTNQEIEAETAPRGVGRTADEADKEGDESDAKGSALVQSGAAASASASASALALAASRSSLGRVYAACVLAGGRHVGLKAALTSPELAALQLHRREPFSAAVLLADVLCCVFEGCVADGTRKLRNALRAGTPTALSLGLTLSPSLRNAMYLLTPGFLCPGHLPTLPVPGFPPPPGAPHSSASPERYRHEKTAAAPEPSQVGGPTTDTKPSTRPFTAGEATSFVFWKKPEKCPRRKPVRSKNLHKPSYH
eukprot:121122-Prorocentrum_minimum.AAC.6